MVGDWMVAFYYKLRDSEKKLFIKWNFQNFYFYKISIKRKKKKKELKKLYFCAIFKIQETRPYRFCPKCPTVY